ncbi:MAG: hypothetical protein HY903_20710 [Deltaproteobacteria bacterium]|nr:hypothetical protein [Deltaproteobacteria bacterium]
MVEAAKGAGSREIQNINVNQREVGFRAGTGKSLDQDYKGGSGNLEVDLFKSSGANFKQAAKDAVNSVTAAGNLIVGVPEAGVGLLYGVVTALPDTAWAGFHTLRAGTQKLALLDKMYNEELDKRGIGGAERARLDATWATVKAHIKKGWTDEDWNTFVRGGERIGKGAMFTVQDGAAAIKNAADGVAEGGAGIVVGAGKGVPYVIGKAIGYTMEYVGAAIEAIAGKISSLGNSLEERSNRIYDNSPEARQIEPRFSFAK